jgi:aspartyl-tRNA(Asn)/glutamyl-tRNA(Gln) amidotransferase subunit A
LSTTLDSVGPLAPTVACCAVVDAVFAGEEPAAPDPVPLDGLRFAVPTTLVTDNLEPAVAKSFEAALGKLSKAGVRIEKADLPGLAELATVGRVRFPSMVEGYAIHRERLAGARSDMDPRIAERLMAGAKISGAEYYDILQFRKDLIARASRITRNFDAVVMPTLAVTAPPIAQFEGSDERLRDPFIIVIRNASIANLLERCALTVPCHEPGAAPVGFMLMGEAMADKRILGIGRSVEAALAPGA